MKRLITLAAASTVLGLALAGCTATAANAPGGARPVGNDQPAASSTPAPTPTKTLSAWDQEQLENASYKLSNGKTVKVDPNKPLPSAVAKDAANTINKGAGKSPSHYSDSYNESLDEQVDAMSDKLGRTVVPVIHAFDGQANAYVYCVGAPMGKCFGSSHAKALAAGKAFVAGRDSTYVLVDLG